MRWLIKMPFPRHGDPRKIVRLRQEVPQSLQAAAELIVLNDQRGALARTEREWKDCLRGVLNAHTVKEHGGILERLYCISVQSQAPIFGILVQRWLRGVRPEIAQQAYADFRERLFQGKIKVEKRKSSAQQKWNLEQAEQEQRRAAYARLNILDIPNVKEYGAARARVIAAEREGKTEEVLGELERQYPKKRA